MKRTATTSLLGLSIAGLLTAGMPVITATSAAAVTPDTTTCVSGGLLALGADNATLHLSTTTDFGATGANPSTLINVSKRPYTIKSITLAKDYTANNVRHLFAFALDTSNRLHRIHITNPGRSNQTISDKILITNFAHTHLASDGGNKLFAAGGGKLHVYFLDTIWATPTAKRTLHTAGYYPKALFGVGPSTIARTTSDGDLIQTRAYATKTSTGAITWKTATIKIKDSGYTDTRITSPGGGIYLRHTPTKQLWRHIDTNPTNAKGSDITTHTTLTNGWTLTKITTTPNTCHYKAPTTVPSGSVTYADLVKMFPGKVGSQSLVEQGLPSLNREMVKGNITTPARKAAFLATIANESTFRYNADEGGGSYTGRGFMQLTNDFNYRAAGAYFGVDFMGANQTRVRSLTYSAPIARWYWTVARTYTNAAADRHDMGRVSAAIGYDTQGGREDLERCTDFKRAYLYLTGENATNVICYRH